MEKVEIPSQGAWILAEERQTQQTTVPQQSCREAGEGHADMTHGDRGGSSEKPTPASLLKT